MVLSELLPLGFPHDLVAMLVRLLLLLLNSAFRPIIVY